MSLILCCLAPIASAVQIDALPLVGFDGSVAGGQFNFITVLVSHDGPEPFEGDLVLERSSIDGLPYVQPLYLSPHSTRAVQFYFYIGQHGPEDLLLKLGKTKIELSPPLQSSTAIWFTEPGMFGQSMYGLKGVRSFNETWLPGGAAAFGNLSQAILDHLPQWHQAQRQAFSDWLHAGGIVHLLLDRTGKFPVFVGELAFLNRFDPDSPQERVGSGWAIYHRQNRANFSSDRLLKLPKQRRWQDLFDVPKEQAPYLENITPMVSNDEFGLTLKQVTQANHLWWAIYLICLAYLVLVGPVSLLCRHKVRDYKMSILMTLLIIGIFAYILFAVGQRGYGEKATISTHLYAQHVGQGQFLTQQWSNIFVTESQTVSLKHQGPFDVYDLTSTMMETHYGKIANGVPGQMDIYVPLYANQPYFHKGKAKVGQLLGEVLELKVTGDRLTTLKVQLGPAWPKQVHAIYAFYQKKFYVCEAKDNQIQRTRLLGPNRPLNRAWNFGSMNFGNRYGNRYGYTYDQAGDIITESASQRQQKVSGGLVPPTIYQALLHEQRVLLAQADNGQPRVALFVVADMPTSMNLMSAQTPAQTPEHGQVIYHFDLFEPTE